MSQQPTTACNDEPLSTIQLSKERLNVIVAYTKGHKYIGLQNDLPWKRKLRADAAFVNLFIRLRPDVALIMGRRTFESIPPKKHLKQIVLTRSQDYQPASSTVVIAHAFEDALTYCRDNNWIPIVFGGSDVYRSALKGPCRIFHTVVEEDGLEGDTVYPGHPEGSDSRNISEAVSMLLASKGIQASWEYNNNEFTENGIRYSFFRTDN